MPHTLLLCAAFLPSVWNDTIESLIDKHNVSPWIAKARIEYEVKKLNS